MTTQVPLLRAGGGRVCVALLLTILVCGTGSRAAWSQPHGPGMGGPMRGLPPGGFGPGFGQGFGPGMGPGGASGFRPGFGPGSDLPSPAEDDDDLDVTTDSRDYCQRLGTRLDAYTNPPRLVQELRAEGETMCADGRVRGGITRLRRALLAARDGEG